jgi:hypothetical protein
MKTAEVEVDTRPRLKDLSQDTRFRVLGHLGKETFFRLCGGGVLTAVSERTGQCVAIHTEVFVEVIFGEQSDVMESD